MQTTDNPSKPAEPRSQKKAAPVPFHERLAYSPAELARAFNRHPSFIYRQIYAGKLKPIRSLGATLIPRAQVEALLADVEGR